jgi:hypothetical protein
MFFNSRRLNHYIIAVVVIFIISSIADKIKSKMSNTDNDQELIQKYLLNDSPLYGYNRPKLWIHSKYEVNSRNWQKFHARNSTDLNQPYLHLTIKSIINHCGKDFNICLIDDKSFSKLLPSWDIDVTSLPEPAKSHFRELGMLQLVYHYGGMVVPNSFICLKNLKPLYNNTPFICEKQNKYCNILNNNNHLYIPDIYFIGAEKNDESILEIIEYIKTRNRNNHFTEETNFKGEISYMCSDMCKNDKITIINGNKIGIKTEKDKPVLIDDLMSEGYINFTEDLYGIYIPSEEVLCRTKYNWLVERSSEDVLNYNIVLSEYLKYSIVNFEENDRENTEITSVISI